MTTLGSGNRRTSFQSVWFQTVSWRDGVFKLKWFSSLLNSVSATLIIVALSWRWWRGGVWQYCKWWSKIPTISVYRSHLYNETGKNITLLQVPLFVSFPLQQEGNWLLLRGTEHFKNLGLGFVIWVGFFFQFLTSFILCCHLKWKLSVPFHFIQEQPFLFNMQNTTGSVFSLNQVSWLCLTGDVQLSFPSRTLLHWPSW